MSYTPTEWKSGDVVTSQKLNKMETGIASAAASSGGVMGVHVSITQNNGSTTLTMDKTYAEIAAADQNGPVFIAMPQDPTGEIVVWYTLSVYGYISDEGKYGAAPNGNDPWYADTVNDYPSTTFTPVNPGQEW